MTWSLLSSPSSGRRKSKARNCSTSGAYSSLTSSNRTKRYRPIRFSTIFHPGSLFQCAPEEARSHAPRNFDVSAEMSTLFEKRYSSGLKTGTFASPAARGARQRAGCARRRGTEALHRRADRAWRADDRPGGRRDRGPRKLPAARPRQAAAIRTRLGPQPARTTRRPSCVLTRQRALIAIASGGEESGANSSRWGSGTRRLLPLGRKKPDRFGSAPRRRSRAMSSSGTPPSCQEVWNLCRRRATRSQGARNLDAIILAE